MKKILSVLLVLVTLLSCSVAMAEMGVQIIGGPETETEPVSLDDIKLNVDAVIDGWGTITPTSFVFQDGMGAYDEGERELYNRNSIPGERYHYYWSGADAEYSIFYVDILNTSLSPKDYLANCEVKVIYDDVYEYGGWYYQRNYNNTSDDNYNYKISADKGRQNINFAINAADQFAIDPMYQGHYIFGCTLPNAVVNSKKPLRMVITIDGNELTYNIRK